MTLDRSGSGAECEVAMHLSPGYTAMAGASTSDALPAFERSLVKPQKQLRRYKRRLKEHH